MKTALVWGASGGIGRSLVSALAQQGWRTVAVARRADDLALLTPLAFEADISRLSDIDRVVFEISHEVEQIDLWVYAAGDIASARVEEMKPADWQRILDANLSGAFAAVHASFPLLAPDAHLFFVGAVSERMQIPGLSAYAAAKAGLEAFAETLRKEARKRRVTVVRPGAVATRFWDKVPFRMPANAMSPEAIAEAILAAYAAQHNGKLDIS
jgi:NAD(P)-dependent dehydrogenase (short-subunit alcohol dehydrogenase family)